MVEREKEASTHHIDSSVQAMMYLVVPDDGVTPSTYLHPSQRVAVDIVVLQHPSSPGKEIYTTLHPTVNLIILESGVAFPSDPHTSVCVGIYLVLDKLTSALGK